MPCLLVILVLAFPRIVLACLFLFTNYLTNAYHGLLIPVIGFFFLPLTTLAYLRMDGELPPDDRGREPFDFGDRGSDRPGRAQRRRVSSQTQ
jgi:hypothetical protein